ncbi:PREDICTED: uncharacterized protein LOC104761080 [Camelina sativa]|uniref:Uncharacterized protein LOC104761080 n=1 Tax=Camelina sativa TaxID=90675 RepID=A0ABM0X8U6_CAMSA|nr:PREDICTED: uncharacterized protein LOC104761080 [Camelina sativa]
MKKQKLEDELGKGKTQNEICAVGIREEKDNEIENDKDKIPHYDRTENGCGAPTSPGYSPDYSYGPSSSCYYPCSPDTSLPLLTTLTLLITSLPLLTTLTLPLHLLVTTLPLLIMITSLQSLHPSHSWSSHPFLLPSIHPPSSPQYLPTFTQYTPTLSDMEAEKKTSDHLKKIGHESSQVDGGNYQDAEGTRIIHVPCLKVALLVGAAATLRFLQHNLCARIRILKDSEVDLKSALRPVELTGTVLQIEFAQQLIDSVLAEEHHE